MELENLVPACRSCNNKKGRGNLERLRRLLAQSNGVTFTEEQLEYLRQQRLTLQPSRYTFYFETLSSDNGDTSGI